MELLMRDYDPAKLAEMAFACPKGCVAHVESCPRCKWLKTKCACGYLNTKCRCNAAPGNTNATTLLNELTTFVFTGVCN